MALTAYLQFGDNSIERYSRQYLLKEVTTHFIRPHDERRPTADAFCEALQITVYVSANEDTMFQEWYISGNEQSGRILIETSDPQKGDENIYFSIKFDGGLCHEISEEYTIDTERRILKLTFSSEKIIANKVEFKRFQ